LHAPIGYFFTLCHLESC